MSGGSTSCMSEACYILFVVDANEILPERLYRLARREYDKMVELGLFGDERVELLQGMLVKKSPQGSRHAQAVARLNRFFVQALAEKVEVRVQSPLAVSDRSEPEPDIVLAPPADYWDAHPSQAFLVIEVAETSIEQDRGLKAGVYATAKIPEYWIVNLAEATIEVYTSPVDGQYQSRARHESGGSFALIAFPQVFVSAADFLPKRC